MKDFFSMFTGFCKKNIFAMVIAFVSTAFLYFIMTIVGDSLVQGSGSMATDVINSLVLTGVAVALLLCWILKKEQAFKIISFLLFIYYLTANVMTFGNFASYLSNSALIGIGIMKMLTAFFVLLGSVVLILKVFFKKDFKICLDCDILLLLVFTFIQFILNCIVTAKYGGILLKDIFALFVQASLLLLFVSVNETFNVKANPNVVEADVEPVKTETVKEDSPSVEEEPKEETKNDEEAPSKTVNIE